jgi:hypothetical protein
MNSLALLTRRFARRFQRTGSAIALVVSAVFAFFTVTAAATAASAYNLLSSPRNPVGMAPVALGVTLTSQQVLLDVIKGFRKWFPGFGMIGGEFRGSPLKLNQRYTAHIASIPSTSTYDPTTGYANGATSARSLLTDVDVVTNNQPTCPLKWLHLDQIKDIKQEWQECMSLAGYALAKAAVDASIFGKMTTRYFTQEVVTTVANFDFDVLGAITTAANGAGVAGKGMLPIGRVLFVSSAVAEVLAADSRLTSKDYAGQQPGGEGYRQWRNVAGFALIQEYPDLAANNGTALTSVTAEADDDLITKVAHGLVTGDPFVITAMTGGTGLATGTRYWAIKASADTFKAATSYANAIAGTAINITADGSAMTVQLYEGLIGFACDKRAFSFLSGLPEGMQSDFADALGIPKTLVFDQVKDPDSGIVMAAAKWQVPGTADFYWVPTFVFGTNAGKEGSTALAANSAAANSILAAANAAGTGADYAGIRITQGVP